MTNRSYPRQRMPLVAAMAAILAAGLAMTGCSAGGVPDLGAPSSGADDGGADDGGGDGGSTNEPARDDDAGGTSLVWNECPIDSSRAPAVVDLIQQLTGFKLIADVPCRFSDGPRVVTVRVVGNNDDVLDTQQPFADRGYRVSALDRGENGFLASGELDAHARANFGDLALVIDMSSFEIDHFGYEALARALMDICVA